MLTNTDCFTYSVCIKMYFSRRKYCKYFNTKILATFVPFMVSPSE